MFPNKEFSCQPVYCGVQTLATFSSAQVTALEKNESSTPANRRAGTEQRLYMEATTKKITNGRYESRPTPRVVDTARIRRILEGEPPSPGERDESFDESQGSTGEQVPQNNNHK